MFWIIIRVAISAAVIVGVSEVAQRLPRFGALLLSLPIISILAFMMTWTKSHDLGTVSRLARETLVLVPLGLPFFLPLAFAHQLGLSYWPACLAGVVLASISIGLWLTFGPSSL